MPESHRFCLTCGTDTTRSPEAKDPLVGKTLVGKYTVVSALGSGAMGTIYKAEQTALGKTVVIKVLHRHLLNDPELIQRFHREARAASRLNHPNCVAIMDFGTLDDGSLYIAMEYIQGIDLATLLEREYPIDHRRLIAIVKQVCMALDEAHANGVLHRDLKPENIMIEDKRTVRDHVKVVDFGIAKLEENNPNSKRSFQTRTGIVCGTPEYMSPEQARGLKLDARSDLYAVGVMLYHLTTDHLPFEAPSPIEVVTKHISEPPRPPHEYREDIPEPLEQLVLTLLEKDREKRPASALDVHAELERIDRELAALRREKVEGKNADDATMVDMKPISDLIEAVEAKAHPPTSVLGAHTMDPQDAETTRRPKEPAKNSSSAAFAHTGSVPLSLTDTIPENVGRALGKRIQVDTKEARPKRMTGDLASQSPAKRASGDQPRPAAGIEPAHTPLVRPAPGNTGPKPVSRPGGNAPGPDMLLLRESITVERKLPSHEELGLTATAAAEPEEPEKRRRVWLWALLGCLVVAAGAAVAVVLST